MSPVFRPEVTPGEVWVYVDTVNCLHFKLSRLGRESGRKDRSIDYGMPSSGPKKEFGS